ncbi:DNA mismatch repair protein MSH3 [Acorus calamus]|uniref:DNA mismatch repair protein MSH3 n=1 Tax=Acorus calamus TaxID=4465 RepID=A0AAV9C8J9_ACOCL|nr:DNA mismatch repair protein MSH3 [Acorus calamus]
MGKQKQQVISRFFAPKPQQNPKPSASSSSPIPPKASATVTFSPSKRRPLPSTNSPTPKKPKTLTLDPPPIDPSLHRSFLDKLLEPSPPPPPPITSSNYTPLEEQVVDLKSRYPDVLLMVEVGYKYRFFGADAEAAARVLGIIAHVDRNFLTASVPAFRLGFHVRRLVAAGFKVGVVRQTETAVIKAHGSNRAGPFSRGLSALYTKATIEAAEELGGGREGEEAGSGGNYLCCVVERGVSGAVNRECAIEGGFDVRVGVVGVEISTGDVMFGEFNDNMMRSGLEAVMMSLSPAELLLGEPLSSQTKKLLLGYAGPTSNVRVERISRDCFRDGGALSELMSLYEDGNTSGQQDDYIVIAKEERGQLGVEGILAMPELAVQALALTIRHLKQFGLDRILNLGTSFRPFSSNIELTLSANTLRQLEVLRNSSDGSVNGSLLQMMNHTCTAFGSRLLKHWICPRSSCIEMSSILISVIFYVIYILHLHAESMGIYKASQGIIELDEEVFCGNVVPPQISNIVSQVLIALGRAPDVQRGITRIFHRTATASEFVAVIDAILVAGKQLQQLHLEDDENNAKKQGKTVKSTLLRRLILTASSSSFVAHAMKLLSALDKDAATRGDLQNLFIVSSGQFSVVFRCHTAVQVAKEKLDLLISQYRKQLGMRNLEFTSVSGSTHLIELPSNVRVPPNWVKVSSTKKAIRYHPPEVLTALDGLMLAKENLVIACKATWNDFLTGFGEYYAEFQAVVQALAALDCLHSLATLSRNPNYVCPDFLDDDVPGQIQICSGRHPVLELILGDNFVPNDTKLHTDGEFCQILTGPNMGGKSCYIRQVALIAIMAQVGSFVPALSAKLHVVDGIYTRMGASDSIQQGSSTFYEELTSDDKKISVLPCSAAIFVHHKSCCHGREVGGRIKRSVKSRIAGKPSIRPFAQPEEDMTHGNHCNLMINRKDNLEEFDRPYARLFHHLQSAFSNSDPMKIMGYLKEAKELAMKMLEGDAEVFCIGLQGSSSSSSIDGSGAGPPSDLEGNGSAGEEAETPRLEDLREFLEKAMKELEVARLNSTMFEERAQSISEAAIAMKDEAMSAWNDVNSVLSAVQEMVGEEDNAKEAVQKATMALSMAEARLQLAIEALDAVKEAALEESTRSGEEKEGAVSVARDEIQECRGCLMNCEAELRRVQSRKAELQKEVDRLTVIAEKAQLDASRAEEEVANIMVLAEQAVAYELEATKRVNDAEIALQKVEKMSFNVDAPIALASEEPILIDETSAVDEVSQGAGPGISIGRDEEVLAADAVPGFSDHIPDVEEQYVEGMKPLNEFTDQENVKLGVDSVKETEVEVERSKSTFQAKKQDLTKDSSPQSSPKALLKKSSRFFSASFFSFDVDEEGSTQGSVFHGLVANLRKQAPKLIFGAILLGMGAMLINRTEKGAPLLQQPDIVTGSPVLGYLAAGILIGPYGLSIIRHVHGTKAIAEFGVVFLLFNIGLELSVERLSSMKKYVFGLGSAQVLVTAVAVGLVAHYVSGLPGPAAIVVGNGLALSSTAVVLQVLQERGESTSRHGRATFSVLLFQVGFQAIAEALGIAALKAIVAITAIIAGGRLLLRPIYRQIAENQNAEIFSANTLLVILGTSLLTARAGLSMALGAFLAGLLLAETEFSLQVESDIAPYRGLLLGLFFMTVGMSIDPKLLMSNFPVVLGTLSVLIAGKTLIVALLGKIFGVSSIAAIRVGLLLAPGGEFAFVAFGEATNQGIMSSQLSSLLFLVVGLSMALTPYIAAGGQLLASRFEQHDVRSLLPVESETDDLQDHIIICGFGRVGQIIAQLLSERLIPFVALDVRRYRLLILQS